MSASYVLKLASLSLASFFVVDAAAAALVAMLSGLATRMAARMQAGSAARFLFALRIAPAALAIFAVFALCIPSYLWLEPESQTEQLGALCIAAALGTVLLWTVAAFRSWRALAKSRAYLESCRETGHSADLPGAAALVVRMQRTTVLAGVLRPVVIVSHDVLDALSTEQVEAALLHERAHSLSRDNLKRLAILLAPAVFPLDRLEGTWKRYAEWAADDVAVAGDRARSIALAEALVRVARLGSSPLCSPLTTSLCGEDLEARVDRLLNGEPPRPPLGWKTSVAVLGVSAAILLRPSTLGLVHRALEKLIY